MCEKLDLQTLSEIIQDGIFDKGLDNHLRLEILDKVTEEDYEKACEIFHATRIAYFKLGLEVASLV